MLLSIILGYCVRVALDKVPKVISCAVSHNIGKHLNDVFDDDSNGVDVIAHKVDNANH